MPNRLEMKMLIISLRKSFVCESQGKSFEAWKKIEWGCKKLCNERHVIYALKLCFFPKYLTLIEKDIQSAFKVHRVEKRKLKVFIPEAANLDEMKRKAYFPIFISIASTRKTKHLEMKLSKPESWRLLDNLFLTSVVLVE